MGEGEFVAELGEREPSSSGADEVTFLIRPNAGLPFAPVAQTASGGELSRIALAIAAVGGGATMIFDEIDAGIGGQTAHAVADTLVRLSERAQVVAITHLPQIASRAERHFSVEKVPGDPTHAIRELGEDERQEEIERMLGGRSSFRRLPTAQRIDKTRWLHEPELSARRACTRRSRADRPGAARSAHEAPRATAVRGRRRHHRPRRSRPRLGRGARRVGRARRRQRLAFVERQVPEPRAADAPSGRRSARRRAGGAALRAALRGGVDHRARRLRPPERGMPGHGPGARRARARACARRAAGAPGRGDLELRRQHDALPPGGGRLLAEDRVPGALETRFRDRPSSWSRAAPGQARPTHRARLHPELQAGARGRRRRRGRLARAGYRPASSSATWTQSRTRRLRAAPSSSSMRTRRQAMLLGRRGRSCSAFVPRGAGPGISRRRAAAGVRERRQA